jgi:hypothetical protein
MNALAIVFLLARGMALAPRKLTSFPQIAVRRIAANASLASHLSNIQGHIRAAHEQIAEFGADFFRFLLKKAAARSVLSKPRRDNFSFGISASVRHPDTEYLTRTVPRATCCLDLIGGWVNPLGLTRLRRAEIGVRRRRWVRRLLRFRLARTSGAA